MIRCVMLMKEQHFNDMDILIYHRRDSQKLIHTVYTFTHHHDR